MKKIKVEIKSNVDLVSIRRNVFAKIAQMAYDGFKLNDIEKTFLRLLVK